MMCMNILSEMQLEMRTVLEDNILSFWEDKMTDSVHGCLLYTSPSPRDVEESRMPSSA